MAEVDVLDDALLSQPGLAQPGVHPPGIAHRLFTIEQQAQSLFKAQIGNGRHGALFVQGGGHAGQAQRVQFFKGRMEQHGVPLLSVDR